MKNICDDDNKIANDTNVNEEIKEKSRETTSEVGSLKKFRRAFERTTGFACEDLGSLDKLTRVMYGPVDPASLGVTRALFGLCMTIDVIEERGLSNVTVKWGDPLICRFPLIHGTRPPRLPWMIIIYGLMWLGAIGMMLGYRFKKSCAVFVVTYWYVHLLDKSFWNNHSYLFGLVALLFWGTGADKYAALDAKRMNDEEKKSVPYWNYFILKFQFFALYFIAGLKKSSHEWLTGYAMINLSSHWVFEPFKLFLSKDQTDLYVVHWFTFIFDLTVGFFMLFNNTRLTAMLLCAMFHLMNSRLFAIGMFPYVCLAAMPLYCRPDWPRKLMNYIRTDGIAYLTKTDAKNKMKIVESSNYFYRRYSRDNVGTSVKQKMITLTLIFYVLLQLFLPYSHFITKGYNNWVPGLYGYSWDMMVHTWDTALVSVRVHDNHNGNDFFIDHEAWTVNDRWTRHGDMVRQYAYCVKDNIEKLKNSPSASIWRSISSNVSVYVDVWCSFNGRFKQRLFDPRVDLLKADWHPLRPISYLMPLLGHLTGYRSKLSLIERDVLKWSNTTDVLFIADYPNLFLDNYISKKFDNVTLHVLDGEIVVYDSDHHQRDVNNNDNAKERKIAKGGQLVMKTGRFHRVVTASPHPACYMYTFVARIHGEEEETEQLAGTEDTYAFPLLKEIGRKAKNIGLALGYVAGAILQLTLEIPIVKKIVVTVFELFM